MQHYLLGRLPGTGEQRDSRLGLRDLMLGGIGGDMGPGPQFRMIDTRLGRRLRTGRVRMGTERGRSIGRWGISKDSGFRHHNGPKKKSKGQSLAEGALA